MPAKQETTLDLVFLFVYSPPPLVAGSVHVVHLNSLSADHEKREERAEQQSELI